MKIFTHDCLTGSNCFIDDDFIPVFTELCDFANSLGLKIFITSAYRNSIVVPGAIVTPAVMSNHLVGHAIDCNIVDNGTYWNSEKLAGELTGNVLALITFVRNHAILRWGGDFNTRDVVHFDDKLNLRDPEKYREILQSIQEKIC